MRFLLSLMLAVLSSAAQNWPQFRGAGGRSVSEDGSPPIEFGPGTNVVWQRDFPPGSSSPVIWNGKLFLTAFEGGHLKTCCLSAATGELLWEKTAPTEKIEPSHTFAGPAAPTPATDGHRLFVHFGSAGLLAYDLEGRELWHKTLPAPNLDFGTASSPLIVDDRVIVLCDEDLGSFLMAVEARTGEEIWKTERPEFRRGFATPFLWSHGATRELVVPGSIWLTSYRVEDGAELWRYEGTSRVATSSPTSGGNLLFSASWNVGADPGSRVSMPAFDSFIEKNDKNHDRLITLDEISDGTIRSRFPQMDLDKDGVTTEKEWNLFREMFDKAGNAVLAIRPGGHGLIDGTHVAWKSTRSLPYVSSPLYYQGRLYTLKNGGLASCYDAETGAVHYQDERLGALGDYYASGVAASGRIYFASQSGLVTVIAAGDELNILAHNPLHDEIFATPAISGSKIFYRTKSHLYCFANPPQ